MGVSAQQHSALVAIAPPEIGNVLTALWSTGANATELLSCESRHVDDDGDRLKLVIQGNRRRVIYVPPATAAMIRSLIVLNGDGPIFRNRSGDAMKASVLRSNVLRLNRTIGSGTVTTHGYRRSVAERLMRWGVSLDVIHEILGHAHRHVLRYYLAANESAVWDAVSRLDADD